MEKKQKFMIAKKIANYKKLTVDEQNYVNDYVNNLLKECEKI